MTSWLSKIGASAGVVGAIAVFGGVAYLLRHGKTLQESLVTNSAYQGLNLGYHPKDHPWYYRVSSDPVESAKLQEVHKWRKRMDQVMEDKESAAFLGPHLIQRLRDYKANPTIDERDQLLSELSTLSKLKSDEGYMTYASSSIVVGLSTLVMGVTLCALTAAW